VTTDDDRPTYRSTATRTERDGVALVKTLARKPDGPTFSIRLRSTRPEPVAVRVEDPFPADVDPDSVRTRGTTGTRGWTRYPGAYAEFVAVVAPGETVTTEYVLSGRDVDDVEDVRGFMHTPVLWVASLDSLGIASPTDGRSDTDSDPDSGRPS
jgi:hypothetical protein